MVEERKTEGATLQHLDGTPMAWDEIGELLAIWQQLCSRCKGGWHDECTGLRGRGGMYPCACFCREGKPAYRHTGLGRGG